MRFSSRRKDSIKVMFIRFRTSRLYVEDVNSFCMNVSRRARVRVFFRYFICDGSGGSSKCDEVRSIGIRECSLVVLFLAYPGDDASVQTYFLAMRSGPKVTSGLTYVVRGGDKCVRVAFEVDSIPSRVYPSSYGPNVNFREGLLSLSDEVFWS